MSAEAIAQKELLAQALREYPTWGHAFIAEKARADAADKLLLDMLAEIERLRAVVEAAQDYVDSEGLSPRQVGVTLGNRLAALEEPEDDVGPPAPGEGDDLENPEIGMVC